MREINRWWITAALAIVSACTPSRSETTVVELSGPELTDLCEQFFDEACQGTTFPYCAPACRDQCSDATTADVIRDECVLPTTVGDVDACAELIGADDDAAFGVCVGDGGGCMIDALERICASANL